jgi:hypothetical protein
VTEFAVYDHAHDYHQQGMLKPIAYTNHRLNSSNLNRDHSYRRNTGFKKPEENNTPRKKKKSGDRKRVTFTKEGIFLSRYSHCPLTFIAASVQTSWSSVALGLLFGCEFTKVSDGEGKITG